MEAGIREIARYSYFSGALGKIAGMDDDDDIEPSRCTQKRAASQVVDLTSDIDDDERDIIALNAAGGGYRKISRIEAEREGAHMCKEQDPSARHVWIYLIRWICCDSKPR